MTVSLDRSGALVIPTVHMITVHGFDTFDVFHIERVLYLLHCYGISTISTVEYVMYQGTSTWYS